MDATLGKHLGDRVKVVPIDKVSTGAPAQFFLRICRLPANIPGAAVALAKRHVPLSKAHEAMTRLTHGASSHLIDVPMVEDVDCLVAELLECGIEGSAV